MVVGAKAYNPLTCSALLSEVADKPANDGLDQQQPGIAARRYTHSRFWDDTFRSFLVTQVGHWLGHSSRRTMSRPLIEVKTVVLGRVFSLQTIQRSLLRNETWGWRDRTGRRVLALHIANLASYMVPQNTTRNKPGVSSPGMSQKLEKKKERNETWRARKIVQCMQHFALHITNLGALVPFIPAPSRSDPWVLSLE